MEGYYNAFIVKLLFSIIPHHARNIEYYIDSTESSKEEVCSPNLYKDFNPVFIYLKVYHKNTSLFLFT